MSAHSVGGDDGLSAGHTRYSTSTPYNIILYYYILLLCAPDGRVNGRRAAGARASCGSHNETQCAAITPNSQWSPSAHR